VRKKGRLRSVILKEKKKLLFLECLQRFEKWLSILA